MKVTQYGGGWQCIARFLRMDQTVLTGLRCATTPPPAGQAAWETANTMPASVTAVPPEVSTTENMSASSVLSFAVKVYNSQRAALSGLIVRVADADGACVREQRCEPIPPRQHRMVELSLPVRVWARSFGPGLRIQAFTGDTAVSEPVMLMPGVTDTLRLLAIDLPVELAAGEAATLQQLINDVGVDGQLASVYPAIRSSLEMVATALISGDHAAARAALAEADNLVIAQQQRIAGQCVHLAGHGHIDMNWLWQWPETVQACRDTFRQALRFMDEFPEFSFNQSQASCYEAMEREAPEVFAAIAKAVANGRWEIVGGMWTEGDTNLSSGEALARSFLLAQRYFIEKLGVRSRTGWLPDNFGHIAQLPQLLRLAGINAFYHMRCGPWEGAQLYWWEAPDGSRVLAKTGQGYGETVTPSIRTQPLKLPKSVPQQMFVYGVGDHGGGPTRKDIMTAKRCARSRLFPAVKFSTAGQYFDTVRPLSAGLRTHKGELQFTLQGCYTSVAAVKRANRALENALQSAEALAAAAGMLGMEWPATALGAAWKTLVFNQFHDILPGSAIHESNRDSIARYTVALERAAEVKTAALRWIGDRVRCARQDGAPFIVFNPLAWRRSDVVTAELVVTEQFSGIRVFDPAGDELPVHIVKTKQFDADIHVWIRFFAKDVPGVGYKVFTARFDAGTPPVPVLHWGSPYATLPCRALSAHEQSLKTVTHRKGIVSNRFFDLAFDRKTGAIRRLQMKSGKTSGRNLAGRKGLNTLAMYIESARHCSGWILDNAARGPLPLEVTRPAT
ncbi:hypothetical protein GX586_01475, partial [bacterium]|nr:hypothetical protein [bacterium]